MSHYSHIALLLVLCLAGSVHGQQPDPKSAGKWSIREFWVQTGTFSAPYNNGSMADFHQLAPGSQLLADVSEGHRPTYAYSGPRQHAFSAMVGVQFGDAAQGGLHRNPLLLIGFSYANGHALRTGMYRTDRIRYDTLSSAQTGEAVFYLDSVRTSHYSMGYRSEQLLLDVSLLFRTNPRARWSVFAGVGLAGGISLNAWTTISHHDQMYISGEGPRGSSFHQYTGGYWNTHTERHRMRNNSVAQAYLPMGINMRIGRKNEFLRKLNLFTAWRPGIGVTRIPELRTVRFAQAYWGMGLRVVWDE